LKPPEDDSQQANSDLDVVEEKWQLLEARWKAILGLEATIDTLRISMEGLRVQLQASWKRTLSTDERVYALAADVVQWNKAKSRVHHVLPKANEFIHRATWAIATPERKKLGDLFKSYIEPRILFPELDQVFEELEGLHKDRQVLRAQAVSLHQECSSIEAEVQAALRTLQSRASANAAKKKRAANKKGKL
jgi:hypothetical protein